MNQLLIKKNNEEIDLKQISENLDKLVKENINWTKKKKL